MTALHVRAANADEFDQVGRICVAAYTAGGHLDPENDYASTLLDAKGRAASTDVLVALRDDVIVGTVTICPSESAYAEIALPGESEFRFLAVVPDAWRTGVGEALVAACEAKAVERAQVAHVICVIDTNATAHRFYERLGFERFPERDWDPIPNVHLQAYRREVPYQPA